MPDVPQAVYPHHVDHIKPVKHGGNDEPNNLALACMSCNLAKGSDLAAEDPETGTLTYFFNPRTQGWSGHFRLEKARIVPLTKEARATVLIFRLNDEMRVEERAAFIAAGLYRTTLEQGITSYHPPTRPEPSLQK